MSKATHIRGPWYARKSEDGYTYILDNRNKRDASVIARMGARGPKFAALIASAPELLEAAIEAEQALSDIVNAARELATDGAHLVLCARSAEACAETKAAVDGLGATAAELAGFGSDAAGKLYAAIAKARGNA